MLKKTIAKPVNHPTIKVNIMKTKTPTFTSSYYRRQITSLENVLGTVVDELSDERTESDAWRTGILRMRREELTGKIGKLREDEQVRNSLLAEMTQLFEYFVDKLNASEYGDNSEDHY